MESGERVEALKRLADEAERAHRAVCAQDVEACLASALALDALMGALLQRLDTPPTPLERAWASIVRRLGRSCLDVLSSMRQPLSELATAARRLDVAVALDARA